ncbi:extracellular solute-binding protein [Arthrobacter bambusae]|uniref:Spermidine/putrescine transport system substrate-binding protein n=1 Tax=Arthrobacter bambusae TaxID=1338426 RepID=A0AAW8DHU5_9MICC|nr:extracellular solute-binding protein [Arthrobacter bambusae]MDP9905556.1 putative spermidine/putrescine transport system substrate-binding protein [Arthrobacter bambusae]MDQ0127362.1 putative spermidine/putrescine transport system substrate-binding protein [Arthrobacter bambusae]MDQ0178704.1 putative spermidine/putrescine transport system substrate-binding protein [Arthrobacter bambusae]
MTSPRWRLFKGAALLALPALALTACGGSASTQPTNGDDVSGELVFSIYPGVFQDNYVKSVVEPFEKLHPNLKISFVQARTSAESLAALRADKNNPSVDVSLLDLAVARTANAEGIFQALDPAAVPNLKDLDPKARINGDFGAGVTFDSVALMYNTKAVKSAPESWNALWEDPAANGKTAIIGPPDLTSTVGLTVITTQMEGGDYKKSVDQGIAKLAKLSSRVETWNPQPDPYTMVQNGSASYGVGWNARSQLFADQSNGAMKAVLPKEGTVLQVNTLNQVKRSPNPKAAAAFINYALGTEAQGSFAKLMAYAPTNTKVQLPADLLAKIPAADPAKSSRVIPLDWDVVVKQRDSWATRLKTEVVAAK